MFFKLVNKITDNDFLYDSNQDFTNELLNLKLVPLAVCRANTRHEAKLIFRAETPGLNLPQGDIVEATESEYIEFLNELENL